jgi:hypothetical protein
MKDGFHDTTLTDRKYEELNGSRHQLPTSPTPRQAKLPMREVKVRKPQAERREEPTLLDEARVSSPTFESTRWQAQHKKESGHRPPMFHEVDELDSCAELEEPQTTPKASKPRATPKTAKAAPQKVLMESSMPVTKATRDDFKEKKRRRVSLDYDDKALSSMAYAQLQQEDFDFNPSAVAAHINSESQGDEHASLLERFLQQSEKEQRSMFANMSIADWEASGDWFIDQFADLMHRLRDARKTKRRIVRTFEEEIANREEMVRLRSEAIDRKLVKMKQDGQRVVEDKDL